MTLLTRSSACLTRLAIAAFVLLTPAIVEAAANIPQTPTLKRGQPVWLGYLVMFFMVVVIISISLMPSKRGHQD